MHLLHGTLLECNYKVLSWSKRGDYKEKHAAHDVYITDSILFVLVLLIPYLSNVIRKNIFECAMS